MGLFLWNMGYQNIVIDKASKLSLENSHLVISLDNEITKIFIGDINSVIINSQHVVITTALIVFLNSENVKLLFCDNKQIPNCLVTYIHGNHNSFESKMNQIEWNSNIKNDIWLTICKNKIRNQCFLCKQIKNTSLKIKDLTINNCEYVEAYYAKAYFKCLFGNDFSRKDDSEINKALNYGYSIIASTITREIISSGIMSELWIHHKNKANNYNLTYDLIEPFRVFIDRIVFTNKAKQFNREYKDELINVLNSKCKLNGKVYDLRYAINLYVKKAINCLTNNKNSLMDVSYD